VTFEKAVRKTPSIRDAYRRGLNALRGTDRAHIAVDDTRLLTGSVDLDTTLRSLYPNESRWDYGVAHKKRRQAERVYWIEIHPATNATHIAEVESKFDWLNHWLANEGALLNSFEKRFIWVSTGRTEFSPTSPHRRRLAAQGLVLSGREFRIT